MKILIVGGSGLIGTKLTKQLLAHGHEIVILDRAKPSVDHVEYIVWHSDTKPPKAALEGIEAVINLVGEPIYGYWTQTKQRRIYDSRVNGTRNMVSVLKKLEHKPAVIISASAVGYYGDGGEEELTEDTPPGPDFLAMTCKDWETEARVAEALGIRTVLIRTAPVIARGGIVGQLAPYFRFYLGTIFGSGKQWFPWISLDDIVAVYVFALTNTKLRGPVNAVSPGIVRHKEFSTLLARSLKRPLILRLPTAITRLLLDQMSQIVLNSQRVLPKKLLALGFQFQDKKLSVVVKDVLA